jgi:shikimate 5-dehydrogenase
VSLPDTVAYDMLYQPNGTPFTQQMQALGAQATWLGHGMLVEQAAEAFFSGAVFGRPRLKYSPSCGSCAESRMAGWA